MSYAVHFHHELSMAGRTGQTDRVDVLPVATNGHVGLTEPDRVLARRDTIERLCEECERIANTI